MKKFFTFSLVLFCCTYLSYAQQQSLYIRFNLVPKDAEVLTGTIGTAIQIEDEVPTDAYLMETPADGSDIYSKTMILPAGDYQYQVVFADGTGSQSTHNVAINQGRPFSLTEEKSITFRAKIYQPEETPYIKFLCDAQPLYVSNTTSFSEDNMFSEPDETGLSICSFTYSNYKGAVEPCISPANSTILTTDVLPTAGSKYRISNAANGKVRWQLSYNRYTLTFNDNDIKKLVTLIDNNLIGIGTDETLNNATELMPELGTFSNLSPLFIKGGTTSVSARIGIDGPAGAEKANDLLKIMPKDILAKMCYKITQNGDVISKNDIALNTTADLETPEYETIWQTNDPVNISNTLENGTYTLNIHFETICHNDTIRSDEYISTFSIENDETTALNNTVITPQITISEGNIQAHFNGNASVYLFSITGNLIDKQDVKDVYNKYVAPGIYLLRIDEKTYKIIVK